MVNNDAKCHWTWTAVLVDQYDIIVDDRKKVMDSKQIFLNSINKTCLQNYEFFGDILIKERKEIPHLKLVTLYTKSLVEILKW